MSVTFFSSTGPLTYSADGSTFPATVVNFVALRANDLFLYIGDYDYDGLHPPVTGPDSVRSIPWVLNGQTLTYVPQFLAVEIGGNFNGFLASDTLPAGPFTDTPYARVSVGFSGPVIGPQAYAALYEGMGAIPVANVPEPVSLVLVGTGVAASTMARRRRK
jgi:hypothetical protein